MQDVKLTAHLRRKGPINEHTGHVSISNRQDGALPWGYTVHLRNNFYTMKNPGVYRD